MHNLQPGRKYICEVFDNQIVNFIRYKDEDPLAMVTLKNMPYSVLSHTLKPLDPEDYDNRKNMDHLDFDGDIFSIHGHKVYVNVAKNEIRFIDEDINSSYDNEVLTKVEIGEKYWFTALSQEVEVVDKTISQLIGSMATVKLNGSGATVKASIDQLKKMKGRKYE